MSRKVPTDQPECANIFEKRIKTILGKIAFPKLVTENFPLTDSATPATCTQNRIARTIFLPTPSLTIAFSSSAKSLSLLQQLEMLWAAKHNDMEMIRDRKIYSS